jgi:hypothetical protein
LKTPDAGEAKARFANSALLRRYNELVAAKHECAASQSESSQSDHLVAAERLRSEPAVTFRGRWIGCAW